MGFLPAILSIASRFVGRVAATTMGWASTLLFGRVPGSREGVIVGIALGAVLWLAMLIGVIAPGIGTFLIALVPRPGFISTQTMRVAMLVGVLVTPAIVGSLISALADKDATVADRGRDLLRGYPMTVAMAILLVFLAGLALTRKVRSIAHGWSDEHLALVIRPGAYEQVVDDLAATLDEAGLDLAREDAPASMSAPARLLAKVAGRRADGLVPDRMVQLVAHDLKVLIYPSDVMISGTSEAVARAHATMASRLATSDAHLTTSANGQALEDRVTGIGRASEHVRPADREHFTSEALGELEAIDKILASDAIPSSDWEVLYRERLQVERNLRAAAHPMEPTIPRADGPLRRLQAQEDQMDRRSDAASTPKPDPATAADRTPSLALKKGSVDL